MKKIYSFFMALSIVLCASANSTYSVDRQLELSNKINQTKVEKLTKQLPQDAARKAISKKVQSAPVANLNGVREYKTLNMLNVEKQKLDKNAKKVVAQQNDETTPADTIVIVAAQWVYKYYAETFDWYMAIADETQTYIVNLDYYSDNFAGTFTEADLDMYYKTHP